MNSEQIIAHRGDNTHYPENTLIAIEEAIKAGAVAFEFDVQMSSDHSLIAFHDENVSRMTGDEHSKIYELSDAEINLLSIHEPEQFEQKHKPTRVTYFEQVTELLKRYPHVQAYVEIKEDSLNHFGNDFVMAILCESLKGFESQATIISFSAEALAYTKANSDLSIGFVFEEHSQRFKDIAVDLSPEYLITWYKVLPEEKVWEGDWKWMVYTVNNVDLAKQLLARGDIDLVETDDIQLLLSA